MRTSRKASVITPLPPGAVPSKRFKQVEPKKPENSFELVSMGCFIWVATSLFLLFLAWLFHWVFYDGPRHPALPNLWGWAYGFGVIGFLLACGYWFRPKPSPEEVAAWREQERLREQEKRAAEERAASSRFASCRNCGCCGLWSKNLPVQRMRVRCSVKSAELLIFIWRQFVPIRIAGAHFRQFGWEESRDSRRP